MIEDAAQAIGANDAKGRQAGTIGHAGCFSFFPTKNLGGVGDGGMMVTDDEELAEKFRVLRVHGGKPKYHHRVVGGNFRLDAIQAAVVRVKLKYLTRWSEARRDKARRYRSLFEEIGLLARVAVPKDSPAHIYNQFAARFPDRDRLQECFRSLGYKTGDFPQAEATAQTSLALPVYPELTEEQQRYVVKSIGEFYQ